MFNFKVLCKSMPLLEELKARDTSHSKQHNGIGDMKWEFEGASLENLKTLNLGSYLQNETSEWTSCLLSELKFVLPIIPNLEQFSVNMPNGFDTEEEENAFQEKNKNELKKLLPNGCFLNFTCDYDWD